MDNDAKAPIIPAGTAPTVFGGKSFPAKESGQADSPVADQQDTDPTDGEDQEDAENADDDSGSDDSEESATTFEALAKAQGFKSPDDLAKAYANLRGHSTRVEMGLSELIKIRQESNPDEADSVVPDVNNIKTNEDAVKVLQREIRKATAPLHDQIALQQLITQHPDAPKYAGAMAKIVKDNPGIKWDVAYLAAKATDLEKTSKKEGKTEAYRTIAKKGKAAAQPAKTASKDARPIQDLIKDRNIPFSEVQRIMRERFSP